MGITSASSRRRALLLFAAFILTLFLDAITSARIERAADGSKPSPRSLDGGNFTPRA